LPLILLIALLVIYPAFYFAAPRTLNKSMERFVGLGNFSFLFKRENVLAGGRAILHFRDHGRDLQGADRFHRRPLRPQHSAKGQRKWRGMLLVPWVIPPAMSTLAWLWLFDPSTVPSTICWRVSVSIGFMDRRDGWARFSVFLVNVWFGAPFFHDHVSCGAEVGADQLYEAAAIDGAIGGSASGM